MITNISCSKEIKVLTNKNMVICIQKYLISKFTLYFTTLYKMQYNAIS